ncbi:MAG TPA: cell envelope integrity protein CreD [Moraxellaceae bacterium]
MKNPLLRKFLMMGALTLLLCIPLRLIGVTVWERSSTRDQVRHEVAASMAGEQKIAGPVLVQPYWELVKEKSKDSDGKEKETQVWHPRQHVWLPERLAINGRMENTPRHRGIYEAQLYASSLGIKASFDIAGKPAPLGENISWGKPYLAISISDVRGISELPRGRINGSTLAFAAGSGLNILPAGVQAPIQLTPGGHYEVDLNLDIKGMERLDVMPLGKESQLKLSSRWPHPSFQGNYLPDVQEIGKNGFSAGWNSTYLSTNIEYQFQSCLAGNDELCNKLMANQMGVRLIDPVDVYLQSERALKYGFLFVFMTFAAFMLYELMKRLRIHAMQYLLVGTAQTLFFLLLVALAEHILFAWAYAIAASACTALLGFYVSYVLRSAWRGLGFGAVIALLFGVLYMLLQSEDYALLMGSLLLFGLLAVAMVLTRNLDWFALGAAEGESRTS